jgi:hypothetical protein
MGADMLVSYVYFKQGVDPESIKKKMLENSDTPTIIAEMLGRPDENESHYHKEDDDEPKTFEEMKEGFKDAINKVFDSLYYRDVASFDFMGYTIYVTGGLSWGDDPTETFNTFERFWAMPELITDIHE